MNTPHPLLDEWLSNQAMVGHSDAVLAAIQRGGSPSHAFTAAAKAGAARVIQRLLEAGHSPPRAAIDAAVRARRASCVRLLAPHVDASVGTLLDVIRDEDADLHRALGHQTAPAALPTAAKDAPRMLRWLLDRGTDVNGVDADGFTALHYAAQAGDVGATKTLLVARANLHTPTPDGRTALWLAAREGHTEVVRALIKAGARPDQAPDGGASPLVAALIRGALPTIRALIAGGARFEPGPDGRHPRTVAVERDLGLMWSHTGQGALEGELMLHASRGNLRRLNEVLRRQPDLEAMGARGTALFVAAQAGEVEVVQALLRAGADPDALNALGNATPLIIASFEGHADVAELLLREGASVAPVGGRTALVDAVRHRLHGLVYRLLELECPLDGTDGGGHTALMYAVSRAPELVQVLLDAGASVHARSRAGMVALAVAVGEPRIMKQLLAHGAAVDAANDDGETPLLLALERSEADSALLLLTKGANPTLAARDGRSPFALLPTLDGPLAAAVRRGVRNTPSAEALGMAVARDDGDAVQALVDKGAPLDGFANRNTTALGIAAALGRHERLIQLLDLGADPDAGRSPALALACQTGDTRAVAILLERGASVSTAAVLQPAREAARSPEARALLLLLRTAGWHPLDEAMALDGACSAGNVDAVRWLLEHGVDPNAQAYAGQTPLGRAVTAGSAEVVSQLLDAGANPAGAPGQLQSPLELAQQREDAALVERLTASRSTGSVPPRWLPAANSGRPVTVSGFPGARPGTTYTVQLLHTGRGYEVHSPGESPSHHHTEPNFPELEAWLQTLASLEPVWHCTYRVLDPVALQADFEPSDDGTPTEVLLLDGSWLEAIRKRRHLPRLLAVALGSKPLEVLEPPDNAALEPLPAVRRDDAIQLPDGAVLPLSDASPMTRKGETVAVYWSEATHGSAAVLVL